MQPAFLRPAIRRLFRQKSFAGINILGLSTGIAACILIYGYVHTQLTYDGYNSQADRIARVTTILHAPESDMSFATSPILLAAALQRNIPGIAATTRIESSIDILVREGAEYSKAESFCYSDPSVFKVFTFTFLEGSPATALSAPQSIVLTKSAEKRYFGKARALGQTMICGDKPWRVTGVIADRPPNSDIPINALLSKDYTHTTSWLDDFSVYTFVLFQDKPDLRRFAAKLPAIARYARHDLDSSGDTGYSLAFEAEALADVHFSKEKLQDNEKGNRAFNTIFSWLAALILLLALLNYINLSTARAAERAKEVGVRKAIGAATPQLARQFLGESFILVTLAWLVALVFVLTGAPLFSRLLSTHLALADGSTIRFLLVLFPLTGLLAGAWPAFVLSRFNPVKALKGENNNRQGISLRKTLTVIQFIIALAMLTGTAVMNSQMQYIRQKDLGMDRGHLVNINLPTDSLNRKSDTAFCDALRREAGVSGISIGSGMPAEGISMASTIVYSEQKKKRELMCNYFYIDPQFLPLLHMSLVAGRNLTNSLSTDRTGAFLVNEVFVKEMGWRSPLGQSIEGFGHKGRVVGVVKNFFYRSIHNSIEPVVLIYNSFPLAAVMLNSNPRELPRLKQLWKAYFPSTPFSYYFMQENFDAQYAGDRKTMSLFDLFTGIALFICIIGLYGLVSLITLQRTKEIGIRKVLGASILQLLTLLTRPLLLLLALAAGIVLPFAGLAGNRWLASYAYHANISVGIFLWSLTVIGGLTFGVTSYHIFRAARANPADSLRSE
ncbi:ABC transporter permease [Puia sp.]|uniref:ABC transporter permease n=1 Tax=Puia sp. TaxID=2045100 RepID=UPI002F405AA8